MRELAGRVAFITGGGSGLGLAMAEAFAGAGMKIVIADVDASALAAAEAHFQGQNVPVLALQLDVTDRAAFDAAAQEAVDAFGAIHVLCNNAGVYRGGRLDAVTHQDWDWVLGVNVGGVVNGLQAVLPHIKAAGEGGHVVNTASMAGIVGMAGLGVYNASKFAVVGLSEALRGDLAETGIGVSVLCPGMVRTRILESERNRPADLAPGSAEAEAAAQAQAALMNMAMATGIDAAEVGQIVVDGVREDRFWLFTHPEMKELAAQRAAEQLDAFGEVPPERAEMLAALQASLAPGTAPG
ncbi:MAG: SDR family NAD(P)-dependent oxidoreductase [Pseudomonadales bacterium]|jgi:NAD(P)-dependent dehydrogenase (short-subunit alcohol dehydrogenase family)|nr:SDR family NAD(P)-dependent oxidoreductase [Pseudomonadales bacterium]